MASGFPFACSHCTLLPWEWLGRDLSHAYVILFTQWGEPSLKYPRSLTRMIKHVKAKHIV